MKIIEKENLHRYPISKGLFECSLELDKKMKEVKVGQSIKIDREEWLAKCLPNVRVSYFNQKTKQLGGTVHFRIRKMAEGKGWLVIRNK